MFINMQVGRRTQGHVTKLLCCSRVEVDIPGTPKRIWILKRLPSKKQGKQTGNNMVGGDSYSDMRYSDN